VGFDKNIKNFRSSNLATTSLTVLLVLRWNNISNSPLIEPLSLVLYIPKCCWSYFVYRTKSCIILHETTLWFPCTVNPSENSKEPYFGLFRWKGSKML